MFSSGWIQFVVGMELARPAIPGGQLESVY